MADQNELWPLPHNWRDGWSENYEFKTEILSSRDDTEQRRALRDLPRVSYGVLSSPLDERGITAMLRLSARHRQSWVLPHARFWTTLASTITGGTNAFTLDTDEPWCAIGRDLIFERLDGTKEWGRIATYAAASGTLEDNVLADIPAGSRVYHGVRGRFTKRTTWRMLTNHVGQGQDDFLAEPGQVYRPDYGLDTTTYNGRPVFTIRPNWAANVQLSWDQMQDVIDQGYGVRGYVDPVDFVRKNIQCEFLVKDQTTLDALYGFFCRRKGQRGSFYMPSWVREFSPVAVTTGSLTVSGLEAFSLFQTDPVHKHITILRTDATRDYIEIASITQSGSDSVLTFNGSIPAITLSDIKFVSWLLPCRFATDRAELNWATNTIAPVSLPVTVVRDDLFFGSWAC